LGNGLRIFSHIIREHRSRSRWGSVEGERDSQGKKILIFVASVRGAASFSRRFDGITREKKKGKNMIAKKKAAMNSSKVQLKDLKPKKNPKGGSLTHTVIQSGGCATSKFS
jgi:hypothetical protein